MSIYDLAKSIHTEIERINQKLGLEIEVSMLTNKEGLGGQQMEIPKELAQIAQQVRHILLSLKDVLSVMPSRKLKEYIGRDLFGMLNSWGFGKHSRIENRKAKKVIINRIEKGDEILKKLLADYENTISVGVLCSRWLDGLDPLFYREPETVLSELLEKLKKL